MLSKMMGIEVDPQYFFPKKILFESVQTLSKLAKYLSDTVYLYSTLLMISHKHNYTASLRGVRLQHPQQGHLDPPHKPGGGLGKCESSRPLAFRDILSQEEEQPPPDVGQLQEGVMVEIRGNELQGSGSPLNISDEGEET